jgi:hypothetical protein
LRIDQSDPATYGAVTAGQFLATAKADPRYREGMTKRPSTAAIKITYVNGTGERQEIGIREIFCRMDGDALVLTKIEKDDGEKLKDLPIGVPRAEKVRDLPVEVPREEKVADPPIAAPMLDEVDADLDGDVDDLDRLHELALAELGDAPESPAEIEPEPEAPRPEPPRERRRPSGPLRKYDEPADPPRAAGLVESPAAAGPAPRGPAIPPPVAKPTATKPTGPAAAAPAGLSVRALNEAEAAALRALIEAKTGQTRWASGLLMQAAERFPSDRKLQNEHLANLLRVSVDPMRAESRTPLAGALRSILEEANVRKAGVLDRDPLKAEKLALQAFARTVLDPALPDEIQVKTVSGSSQKTPAQILAKLEDPKLARATRVKYLLEVVPEMIEGWRPDKESGRSEAGNENSPAIVRKLFSVANEQRQQRKFIDDSTAFRKANERYAGLETRLPKPSAGDDS